MLYFRHTAYSLSRPKITRGGYSAAKTARHGPRSYTHPWKFASSQSTNCLAVLGERPLYCSSHFMASCAGTPCPPQGLSFSRYLRLSQRYVFLSGDENTTVMPNLSASESFSCIVSAALTSPSALPEASPALSLNLSPDQVFPVGGGIYQHIARFLFRDRLPASPSAL